MIKINFSPVRGSSKTTVSVSGSVLTLDNVDYDLSLLDDGSTATHDDLGKVTRTGDDYECTVTLTHGKAAPHETRFPEPVELDGEYQYTFEVE